MESDLVFVRRLLARDEDAFEQFFEASYPALYRFALARLDFDEDAAGDVAQTALVKAMAKLHTFRGEAALLTWLCTFCRHEVHAWRRQHARPQVELVEDDPEIRAALETLRLGDDDPGEAIDRTRMAALVQTLLDHLPPHYANALEWKYIDELSVQDIATRLGLGHTAAESLLARARQAFREGYRSLAASRT